MNIARSRITPIRVALHLLCALPASYLIYSFFYGSLGFNPVETLTHQTGIWALRILLLSLAITPLRLLLNTPQLLTYRRLLGLWAFAYALIHFAIYLTFDLQFSLALVIDDVLRRPYLTAGFTALAIMIPLTITSTKGWQRRMRANWGKLHKLVYISAIAAILHFVWLRKGFQIEPLIYAGILVVLFAQRLWNKFSPNFKPASSK